MDISCVSNMINKLKEINPTLITNFNGVLIELSSREFSSYETDKSMIITYWDGPVCRLLYFSCDANSLRENLSILPAGDYLMEKVNRVGFESDIDFCSIGFQKVKALYRYTNNRINEFVVSDAPVLQYRNKVAYEQLDIHSFDSIKDILWTTFDPNVSHLPDDHTLEDQIRNGEFVGIIKGDVLTALIQRRMDKLQFHIDQIINRGSKEGIHAMLLGEIDKFVSRGGKMISSWIEEDNIASLKFHEKYGLVKDRTYVYIFTYHKGKTE